MRWRWGLTLTAAVAMLGGLASCGQSHATTPTNSAAPPVGVFTLSASGCGYEGNAALVAGRGSITLANKISTEAHFDFWRLDQGRRYSEFLAHIQEAQRRFQAGEPELGHPTFANLSTSTTVATGATKSLVIPGVAGSYAMACIAWNGRPTSIFAAGPVEISG